MSIFDGTGLLAGAFAIGKWGSSLRFMARILLVEDDFDVRQVMEHVLIDGGHQVDKADAVPRAEQLLASRSYDLVLADGRLVNGTGMELADQAVEKGAAVLIVTGYAFDLPKDGLKRFEYLLKPVSPNELIQAVDRALQSARRSC
jgi:two-component system, NtrC family, response regulator HydG